MIYLVSMGPEMPKTGPKLGNYSLFEVTRGYLCVVNHSFSLMTLIELAGA